MNCAWTCTRFQFGPHAAMEFGALRVSLSAGFALNIADTEASTREVLKTNAGKTLKTWAQESNDTEVLPGLYVEASAERPLSARCSVFVAARYDWAEKLEGQVGASRYSLETGGLTGEGGHQLQVLIPRCNSPDFGASSVSLSWRKSAR